MTYSRDRAFAWFLFACLGLISLATQPAYAEWPEQSCSFRHRIPVTVTAGPSGHNAEIRIDLTNADIPADYVFSVSGEDTRVFLDDDLTSVDFVVAGWDDVARLASFYIRLPTMAAGSSQTVYIYLGDETVPSGNSPFAVFPDAGVRLRSRVSTANPISPADGLAAFEAAATDVDDSVRTTISGLNNRALGGTNGNFGWCVSAVLNVTSATTGLWEFRYGGDFGRGGHLYVRSQELEEQWNDDLWWAGNFANTNETLEGSITLPEGWHRYEALGFEGCCDGGVGFQARAPGGPWQDLTSTNFPIRAAQCIATSVTVTIGTAESCSTTLDATKSISVDGSSPSSYLIPGAVVRYDLEVTNPGQRVDDGTIALVDIFPPNVSLLTSGSGVFEFTDGANPSGLSFNYAAASSVIDDVEFSTDGIDFTYTPSSPLDDMVTHIRLTPSGEFSPNDGGNQPSFTISILGEVQ